MNRENKKIEYLLDEPNSNVELPIVDSIKNEIEKKNEGKVIGILGGWGSGKSSIIDTLEKRTKDSCLFIKYDAWKNEKFPFKIGLLKYILNQKLCSKDKINSFLINVKELEQAKEITNQEEHSILNFANVLFLISVLFYPLAFDFFTNSQGNIPIIALTWQSRSIMYLFFSILILTIDYILSTKSNSKNEKNNDSLSQKISNATNGNWSIPFISLVFSFVNNLAWFIIFAPVFIWSVFDLIKMIKKISKPEEHEYNFLNLAKPETKTCITIDKSPEPNFCDFSNLFGKILSNIKSNKKNGNKNIIIVIDNIDRIDSEEAKIIWSSLKGMVLKNKSNYLLIPIDPEQIKTIYTDECCGNDDVKISSFIQKTFDITFRVPPRVISNAREILNEKLKEAFPFRFENNDDLQLEQIMNIINTRNEDGENFVKSSYSGMLTPRKIIKLINDVLVLESIDIFDNISLNTKFAYCLHFNNISKKLQNNELLGLLPETCITLREIDTKQLAALYYQVEEDRVLEIVKKDSIYNNAIHGKLSEEDAQTDGIWQLFYDTCIDTMNSETFLALVNILDYSYELNSRNENKEFYDNSVKNILKKIVKLGNINQTSANTIKVFEKINISEYKEKLFNLIYKIERVKDTDFFIDMLKLLINKYNVDKKFLRNSKVYITNKEIHKAIVVKAMKDDVLKNNVDISILKSNDDEKILNDIESVTSENEFLTSYADLIIDGYIGTDENDRDIWNEYFVTICNKLIEIPLTMKAVNRLKKCVIGYKNDSEILTKIIDFIKSNEKYKTFLSGLCYQKSYDKFGNAFALYFYLNKSYTEFYTYLLRIVNYSCNYQNLFRNTILKDNNFIKNFIKSYLELNKNNITSLFQLDKNFLSECGIFEYLKDNPDYTNALNMDGTNIEFANYYDDLRKKDIGIEKILENILKVRNMDKKLQTIDFSKNNEFLLYDLIILGKKNIIKDNANEYFKNIEWDENINYNPIFKASLLLDYESDEYNEAVKNKLLEMMCESLRKFMQGFNKNELDKIIVLDKKLLLIDRLFCKNEFIKNLENKFDNDFFMTFKQPIMEWFRKTTHDKNTLFSDFVIKLDEKFVKNNLKDIIKKIPEDKMDAFKNKFPNIEI